MSACSISFTGNHEVDWVEASSRGFCIHCGEVFDNIETMTGASA